jgi:hypothetical protein
LSVGKVDFKPDFIQKFLDSVDNFLDNRGIRIGRCFLRYELFGGEVTAFSCVQVKLMQPVRLDNLDFLGFVDFLQHRPVRQYGVHTPMAYDFVE